jgi:hypothetical protein
VANRLNGLISIWQRGAPKHVTAVRRSDKVVIVSFRRFFEVRAIRTPFGFSKFQINLKPFQILNLPFVVFGTTVTVANKKLEATMATQQHFFKTTHGLPSNILAPPLLVTAYQWALDR